MKLIPLYLIIGFALSAQAQNIKSTYDKFKDQTTVFTDGSRVRASKTSRIKTALGLRFFGYFRHPAQALKQNNDTFVLRFEYTGREWGFLKNNGLILILDGKERIDLGKPLHNGELAAGRYAGVNETMIYPISREELTKLASAEQVEMQLGSFEGEMDKRAIGLMKNLLKAGTVQ
jgi:hypothetical protein